MKIKKLLLAAICIVSAVLMLTIAASAAVAEVNGVGYDTFYSAVKAADGTGYPVELLTDVTDKDANGTSQCIVAGNYTVNGNGFTITYTDWYTNFWGSSNITFNNVTIAAGYASAANGGRDFFVGPLDNTKLTFNDVTFEGLAEPVMINHDYAPGVVITLNNTTIPALVSSGSSADRSATVILQGKASIGVYRPSAYMTTQFASDFTGNVLYDVTVDLATADVEDGADLTNVTCTNTTEAATNSNGELVWGGAVTPPVTGTPVAKIGTTEYTDFAAALANRAGATIVLLDNVTTTSLPDGTYDIDGQGMYTLTLTESASAMWGANAITLMNLNIKDGAGGLDFFKPGNTTRMTLMNVTFEDFTWGVLIKKQYTDAGARLRLVNTNVTLVESDSSPYEVVLEGTSSIDKFDTGVGTTATFKSDFTGSVFYPDTARMTTGVVEDGADLTNVTAAVYPGYTATNDNGALTWAEPVGVTYVAQIGVTKYATIDAALADKANGTIELLEDVELATLPGGTYTIDGAGNTITLTASASAMWGANNITIKNAVVSAAGADIQVVVPGNTTTVTFENVTFVEFLYGVNLTKGYTDAGAALTLNNTSISSFVGDGNPFDVNLYGTASIADYRPSAVTATTFAADFAGSVDYRVSENLATAAVIDGATLTNVTLNSAAGIVAYNNNGALAWNDTNTYVAQIGSTKYTTFDAALADKANGQILLLDNVAVASLPSGVDINGQSFTITVDATAEVYATTISLSEVTIASNGVEYALGMGYSTLNLDDVTFTGFALDVYAIWGEGANTINIAAGNLPNIQFKGGANYAFVVNAEGDVELGTIAPSADDVINVSGQVTGVIASATVDNVYVAAGFNGALSLVSDAPASGVVVGQTGATSFANTGIVKSLDDRFFIVPKNGELVLVEGASINYDAGYYEDGEGVIRFMVTYNAELAELIDAQYGLYAASTDLSTQTSAFTAYEADLVEGDGIIVDVIGIPEDARETEIIPVAFAKVAGIDEMVYFFGDSVSVTTAGNKYLGTK